MITLTKQDARRFILKKQGLLSRDFSGKESILSFVKQVGCLQYDPIDVVGKNAELVLFSRIENVEKRHLHELLYTERKLLDQWDKNMAIYLTEDFPKFTYVRNHNLVHYEKDMLDRSAIHEVIAYLKNHDGVTHHDLAMGELNNRFTWRTNKLAQAVLDYLFFKGDAIVYNRDNTKRSFALTKNHLDETLVEEDNPHTDQASYQAWHLLRRIGAMGLLWNKRSDALLGIVDFKQHERKLAFERLIQEGKIYPCSVEGIKEPLYYSAEDQPLMDAIKTHKVSVSKRLEFIAPLDNLLWDRALIKAIFDFDYTWEIYTPAIKRKFGHYVLPILYKDKFVGRIQMNSAALTKTLTIENIWIEDDVDQAFSGLLNERLSAMATYNGCTTIVNNSTYNIT